ncbi:hypothetical protein QAD02_011373 [Eretmocerus hayati]|uniref:Uncharacterized protein n=1 Tax=Eretmocerus hayati TaxID=131215 RepID=A0ACC2NWV3_9HYME|nr:hypothetical protein QAD02_011373 [Eretmocerus hayati]
MQLSAHSLYFCCLALCLSKVFGTPIWAGEVVVSPSFPYFVSIEVCNLILCGGSIIHPNFVITAAHCFDDFRGKSFYKIRSGTLTVGKGGNMHSIQDIERHPHYDFHSNLNDIALVIVKDTIIFDNFRKPIPFNQVLDISNSGKEATVIGAGWTEKGPVNRLKRATVLMVDKSECNSTWINEDGSPIPNSMICAGVGNDRQDTCDNDSGGPLIIDGFLAGITSFGFHKCGTPGIPSLYTEVAQFHLWIDLRITEFTKRKGLVAESNTGSKADGKVCHYPKVKTRISSKDGHI